MTDTKKLEKIISDSGLKKGFLAKKIGVSRSTFYALMRNEAEFKASQIKILCDLLGIRDRKTMQSIFFGQGVALKATERGGA